MNRRGLFAAVAAFVSGLVYSRAGRSKGKTMDEKHKENTKFKITQQSINSVLIISAQPAPATMTFHEVDENGMAIGEPIGTFEWTNGKCSFTGNMEESAKLFFEFVKPYVEQHWRDFNEQVTTQ